MKLAPLAGSLAVCLAALARSDCAAAGELGYDRSAEAHAVEQVREGRDAFRNATFGDEDFWGGALHLHEGLAGVSPKTALAVGLKVDVDALPKGVVRALRRGADRPRRSRGDARPPARSRPWSA